MDHDQHERFVDRENSNSEEKQVFHGGLLELGNNANLAATPATRANSRSSGGNKKARPGPGGPRQPRGDYSILTEMGMGVGAPPYFICYFNTYLLGALKF